MNDTGHGDDGNPLDAAAPTWADRTSAKASDAFEVIGDAADAVGERVAAVGERASAAVDKTAIALHVPIPVFRGLLHLIAAIIAIAAGIVLVVHARHPTGVIVATIYSAGLLLNFATSAVYHRMPVRLVRVKAALRKADHSSIYLVIVSSFTPFAMLTMRGNVRWVALLTMWGVAAVGVTIRLLWKHVPRRILASTYLVLGWGCLVYSPWMAPRVSIAPGILIGVCGVCYSIGAIVYMRKRPNPSPRVFGFHEVFHALTIVGAACQWTAVWMLLA